MKRHRGLLNNISAERIFSELSKLILGVGAVSILLQYEDVIKSVLPSVGSGRAATATDYERAVREMEKTECDLHLRLAMLLRTPEGALDVKKLKADGETIRSVKDLTVLFDERVEDKISARRLRRKYSVELLKKALAGKRASGKLTEQEWEREISLIEETENDPVTPKELAVGGEDIMALGVPRGQGVGEMLEYLLELVITDSVENDREKLMRAVNDRLGNQ